MRIRGFVCLGMLFLLLTNNVSGQNDYNPGYIITYAKDTVYGEISLRSNYQNSKECIFREGAGSSPVEYFPSDIMAYRFENSKYYITKQITLEDHAMDVFLEMLLDGIVDLYYYKDIKDDFYFIEKENKLYQLSNQEIEVIKENEKYTAATKKYVRHSNQYIGILSYLFQETPQLSHKIQSTDFSYKSLINITEDYHGLVCSEYECIDYTKSTKGKVYMEAEAGWIYSWMGLKSSEVLSRDNNYVIGINFRFISARIHNLWGFLVGINYSSNQFHEAYPNQLFQEKIRTYEIDLEYDILRIPLKVEYTFPTKRIQPFISLGYNNVFLLNPDYEVIYVYYNPYEDRIISIPKESDLRSYQSGLLAGVGARFLINDRSNLFMRLDFEYRFPTANLRNVLDFQYVMSGMINLGYSFQLN